MPLENPGPGTLTPPGYPLDVTASRKSLSESRPCLDAMQCILLGSMLQTEKCFDTLETKFWTINFWTINKAESYFNRIWLSIFFCCSDVYFSSFLDRPEIIYHLIEETAVVNETVSLPCVAIGNPSANVSWEWKGKPIKSDSHFIVGRNGSLVIENVTRKDEGVFTCTPFNKWFGEKKQTKLVVLGELFFVFFHTPCVIGYFMYVLFSAR